jgi:tetratricopeptide (TPR) repeat protein
MDIVAYSRLPTDEQQETISWLQGTVRATREFHVAGDNLVCLPTGDGMALAFFTDAEAALRCALEIATALRSRPGLSLRMGIHTGPVYRVSDINEKGNVAGAGINIAQRVMDCADGGHILLSRSTAEVLRELSAWAPGIHDLGETEVKHGVRVHLFNFHTAEHGNRQLPSKVEAARRKAAAERRPWPRVAAWMRAHQLASALAGIALVLMGVLVVQNLPAQRTTAGQAGRTPTGVSGQTAPAISLRPAVAVLALTNTAGQASEAWLGTAVAEMLSTELAAGEKLSVVPGDEVARMRAELSISEAAVVAGESLSLIHDNLGTNFLVTGSYLLEGTSPRRNIRLDLRLLDRAGQVVEALAESGPESELSAAVSRAGQRLRDKLGLSALSAQQLADVAAAVPRDPQAARWYSDGLARLRSFDALAARDLLLRAAQIEPDSAAIQSALAGAWSVLGYDARAAEAANEAVALSSGLPKERRLLVEARALEMTKQWAKATEVYRSLTLFYPDNLEYALQLAKAQSSAGNAREAVSVLEGLGKLPEPAGSDPRIDLQLVRAYETLGDFKRAQEAAAAAAGRAKKRQARLLEARARVRECWAFFNLGSLESAQASCEAGRQIYSVFGDRVGYANALANLGNVAGKKGDWAQARKYHEEALAISLAVGAKVEIAGANNNLAKTLYYLGDEAGARRYFQASLRVSTEIGDKKGAILALNNLAVIYDAAGDVAAAKVRYQRAVELAREIGDKEGLARALENYGRVLADRGSLSDAKSSYEEALKLWREIGAKSGTASTLNSLGDLLLAEGDLTGAENRLRESLEIYTAAGDRAGLAVAWLSLAALTLEQRKIPQAADWASKAAEEFAKQSDTEYECYARALLARARLRAGQKEEAKQELDRAVKLEATDRLVVHAVILARAEVLSAGGPSPEARRLLGQAVRKAAEGGFLREEFELRLLLVELRLAGGDVQARREAERLRETARSHGFGQVALRAAQLGKS